MIGRDAIRSRMEDFIRENTDRLESTVSDLQVLGDVAIVRGRYTESWSPSAGGDTTSVEGTGIQIYERQPDGSWLLTTEIWNTDAPAS